MNVKDICKLIGTDVINVPVRVLYQVEWLSLIWLDLLNIGAICYDDVCHLLKYAQKHKRVNLTDTMKKIGKTKIVVDKFHFGNHMMNGTRSIART